MLLRQLFDRESSTYTYLLAGDAGEALLIDPVQAQLDSYLQLLRELKLSLVLALDTHTHADHVTAMGDLRSATGCVTMMGRQSQAECVSARFDDEQVVGCNGVELRALYTPGHTDESYSFFTRSGGVPMVFTGDALLIRGTGRTDFQNGDARAAYRSLFNRLLTLPDETLVYPGHDYKGWSVSTIGEERLHNPRLQVKSADEYAALMASLKLPSPALMDVALPANLRCGRR
ncbi:MAG TPA: MBL fold metallo-hydrolase [Nevskiaceae bacterium]|nr:MBL fold metallo-hydrolase [Nevskiaceae bacterium]